MKKETLLTLASDIPFTTERPRHWQLKDTSLNPGTVGTVFFTIGNFLKLLIASHRLRFEIDCKDTCQESILSDNETCDLTK